MKLTLQLVVVVLNAPTTFRNNLFKFTLYTIYYIQGRKHKMPSWPPCSLSNTAFSTKFELQR